MRMCFSCRELIDGPAIVSEGNFYHPDHFCCQRCKQPVGGGFHIYKVWRLCSDCLPRPVCSSNQCSQPDRRIGHGSGAFYRLPVGARLEAFHGCHTVRCSVCGRGISCCGGSPADGLAYHLNDGRPTCTRCYYHVDHFNRWQRTPGSRGAKESEPVAAASLHRPPLPDEFTSAVGRRRVGAGGAEAEAERSRLPQRPSPAKAAHKKAPTKQSPSPLLAHQKGPPAGGGGKGRKAKSAAGDKDGRAREPADGAALSAASSGGGQQGAQGKPDKNTPPSPAATKAGDAKKQAKTPAKDGKSAPKQLEKAGMSTPASKEPASKHKGPPASTKSKKK